MPTDIPHLCGASRMLQYQILFKLAMSEEGEAQEISIEDLQLSLEVHEIESEEKLKKLEALFGEKKTVDLSKMFYEERSSLQIKFQNIVSDLTEFLINQEIASTDKLRKTFFRLLENPLIFLYKVSRFEIFNLRLNAFDIELEPIDAITELSASILENIEKHQRIPQTWSKKNEGNEYETYEQFLHQAQIKLIQDQIFLFYSYLRKGGNIIRKKFEDKIRVVELYGKIEEKLLKKCIETGDSKTLKELSILNYELYLLQNTFDVLCFYLKVPFRAQFADSFKELQTLATKAKQSSNYDFFILIFLRYSKEILAKIEIEGIDPIFSSYIENTLKTLLELWGCLLCHYQEFYDLFEKLLLLHPKKHTAIEICLKHSKLQKEDIVLRRANFKHDLMQKHRELLSLLKTKTIEQINASLSDLYHRTLYNLDFKDFSREEILSMLTSLNGKSSLGEFFGIVERALKEWNHTIDLSYAHKYIENQFKFPKIDKQKVIESLRLFNNLCILEQKSMPDFEPLIKAGTIQLAFTDLCAFLLKSEEGVKLIQQNDLAKVFITNALQFFTRTAGTNAKWSQICLVFTSKLTVLTEKYASIVIEIVKKLTNENSQSFTVKSIVNIYQNIIISQQSLKIDFNSTVQTLNHLLMKGTSKKNEDVKLFRFFDSSINSNLLLTATEEAFLRKNSIINGEIIEAKDNGCFVLSELQVITNPVQFDKVMDNYYFTLDNNAKKYVQYLVSEWVRLINSNQTKQASIILSLMQNLVALYPISLPLFCTTRIYLADNATKRFIEVFVDNVNAQSFSIINSIIECRCIRFKSGRDYIKEEIISLILKQSIKIINEGTANIHHFELLAASIKHSKNTDLKTDLIQKALEAINFQISQTTDPQALFRHSNSHYHLLNKFFEKKEVEMRKKNLQKTFIQLADSETRTKILPVQTDDSKVSLKKSAISQQIMITPFAISQQFNSQDAKIEKVNITSSQVQIQSIPLSKLKSDLPAKTAVFNVLTQKPIQNYKTIDLTGIKYNIQCHLGSQLKNYCLKEGFKLITNKRQEADALQNNEQNTTLVQYYLKQFRNPEISSESVLGYIKALIDGKVQYSSLFVNYSNLQKLFFGLMLVFRFASSNAPLPKQNVSKIDHILSIPEQNKLGVQRKILQILAWIGYTNIWAQSYNSLASVNYYKELRQKSGYKDESAEESFFSLILKICLQKEQLKDDLNSLLGKIFSTRPNDQNSLMYKVSIDRGLLNSIMKSLQIKNLSYVSHFFHSNFNNLRLYTDQLHEGMKALGMASKNRAYNEYVQLSKDIEDQQFFLPMKLFKENFSFFIRIEKEGYKFKRNEQQKLGRERVLKVLRSGAAGDALLKQIQKVVQEFEEQLQKLEYNIANRVKSFYLVTKLRDLSYQNSLTVCLLHQILTEKKENSDEILKKIKQVQVFSLISELMNKLVKFGKKPESSQFLLTDRFIAQKQVSICSTRRYSHSISKIYEKCQLQLDEVFQRCLDVLRVFFASNEGKQWLSELDVYPPFLTKSFISFSQGERLIKAIKDENIQYLHGNSEILLVSEEFSFSSLLKSLRQVKKAELLQKDNIKIQYKDKKYTLSELLVPYKTHLIQSETLSKSKDGYLLFNKYKTSQKTLQEIQILGLIVGYCVYHGIEMDLPFHSSILNAANFGACDLDDLLDIDFKVWQDLRNVISITESKDLNLNFSYIFESLQTLKPERVELIDKGTSKKVNNLNREEYTDAVSCYLFYKIVGKQTNRFLQALIYVCPKEILSSLRNHDFLNLFLKKYPNYLNEILKRIMKRRALILPVSVVVKGKRYENSMDYQSIQWFNEIMENQQALRQKLWPNQSNLFLCTWMGQGADIEPTSRVVVIGRFGSKEQMKESLIRLA